MNDYDTPAEQTPIADTPPVTETVAEATSAAATNPIDTPIAAAPLAPTLPVVDPVRSAAGRLGGQRVHRLVELGRQYEREHGLKAGRQRLKQLIQLGKKYEVEHGLRAVSPRRKRKGVAWQEFLSALAQVVKPAYRPAVERLATGPRLGPNEAASELLSDQAA